MRKYLLSLFLLLSISPALADWTGKDASGTTITFKNPNTCSSVVCVPINQLVDGTGAAIGVVGSPLYMGFGTGVQLPAFAATPTMNLGTLNGAATAAKQPALGTAGTPSADVISIQGVVGGTPQPGSLASGSVSAGAYAAGAVVAGAFVDGWDITQGAKADAAYTGSGSASVVAILKGIYTTASGPIALNLNGTATAQTGLTPGTTQTGTIVAANTDETSWAGTALGAPSNYGTSPGAVKVPGVNAFVTNFPGTQAVSGTFWPYTLGQQVSGSSVPVVLPAAQITALTPPTSVGITGAVGLNTAPSLANGNGVVPTQGGAALSPTNPMPTASLPGTLNGGQTFVSGTTAAMTGTTSTQVLAAVASNRLYVTRVKCNNSSTTATLVQIRDGSAGTVLDTLAAGATYGGEQATGATPLFWTTAGNALFAQDVTTGASVICTASGYSGL